MGDLVNDQEIEEIATVIVDYVCQAAAATLTSDEVPMDRSLLESGILDSYGIIELVEFIENTWSIQIEDEEITVEIFGSIRKMASLVHVKITP